MPDFSSAAQWVDEAMTAKSYLTTEKLDDLRKRDADAADAIEGLCFTILALRGFAITLEAKDTLRYSAKKIGPWITPVEAFDEVQRLKGASRLPAEIQPHEVEEYKRLQRFLNSSKAVQRIVSKRQGGA
jgi:hypothetical protein